MKNPSCRVTVALLLVSLTAGCAQYSSDGGFTAVERITRDKISGDVKWTRTEKERDAVSTRVRDLLTKPLSVDDAVQVALLNNRGLQADFAELGIAESDLVDAGRLPNPGFSYRRTRRGEEIEIERGLQFNLARLLAMPFAIRMESQRMETAQSRAALAVIRLAGDTRKAYFQAVAATETVRYMRQVQEAADAGAELAQRMAVAGNWSRLQQAREQVYYADAALNVARAEQASVRAREALTRLLGSSGAQTMYTLPERLPDLPKAADERPDIEQRAMETRLDVQSAKRDTESLASNLGLSKATRFINVLEAGVTRETSNIEPVRRGYEISLELPLFDWGTTRVAKAETRYMQAVDRTAQIAVDARSQVRESYQAYRTSYDIARHYRDEVVPIRKRIADENMLRYNGMLIGVFELLADARLQISSVNSYIEALREFWLAESDLQMAMIGQPGRPDAARAMTMTTETTSGDH
ncbi:MAG: TolC family protein [Betaproteobacteria bacterium]